MPITRIHVCKAIQQHNKLVKVAGQNGHLTRRVTHFASTGQTQSARPQSPRGSRYTRADNRPHRPSDELNDFKNKKANRSRLYDPPGDPHRTVKSSKTGHFYQFRASHPPPPTNQICTPLHNTNIKITLSIAHLPNSHPWQQQKQTNKRARYVYCNT